MALETQRWNYKVLSLKPDFLGRRDSDALEAHLNQLGRDGWELVAIVGMTYYFKRPV